MFALLVMATLTLKPGDTAHLVVPAGADACVVSLDFLAYIKFGEAWEARDEVGVDELIKAGRCVEARPGTPVRVLGERPALINGRQCIAVECRTLRSGTRFFCQPAVLVVD